MTTDELGSGLEMLLASPQMTTSANFADYDTCAPHVCCGWMDLHEDLGFGVTKESPYFSFRAKYWDPDAYLVATNANDDFYLVPRTTEVVTIDATKPHALLPKEMAMLLIATQDPDQEGEMVTYRTAPKLVWDWIDLPAAAA
ncbi:hypothetical protein LC612_33010 [Nostoc sp. CHAB 5834]|nr:hypothetical protein [Nostoc sp. CHAB 5834]